MRYLAQLLPAVLVVLSGCGSTREIATAWEPLDGPAAQNVSALLSVQPGSGTLLAGLTTGDLFGSPDGGGSWSRIGGLVPPVPISRFVQDPDRPEVILTPTEAGLFLSLDRGRSWRLGGPRSATGKFLPCRALAIDPWKSTVWYAGTAGNGIYKSTDRGETWVVSNGRGDSLLASRDIHEIAVAPSHPDILFAAASGIGIARSTDGGETWARSTPLVTSLSPTITHVLIHPHDDRQIIYASDIGTVARSTDRGETWIVTNQEEEAWRILSLIPDPSTPDQVYAGAENGLWVSTNFGASWSNPLPTLANIPTSVTAVAAEHRTKLYVYGAGLGLQVSRDGGRVWERADNHLGGAFISLVSSDPAGHDVYAAVGSALLRYDGPTASWLPASSGLSGGKVTSVAFDVDSTMTLFATTTGGAFKSIDRGDHWKPIARNVRMSARYIDTHPTIRTRMLASGPSGIFVSTDKGNSWSQTQRQDPPFEFTSLTFTPTNAGIIHAATQAQGVLLTTDGGIRWEQSRYGISSDAIAAITMNAATPGEYFAWTKVGECFRSTDKGLEWKRFVPPWGAEDSVQIAYDRLQPYSVVALINGRDLFYSHTGGRSWVRSTAAGALTEVTSLHWNARTSTLYAGTSDRGLYRISLVDLVASAREE